MSLFPSVHLLLALVLFSACTATTKTAPASTTDVADASAADASDVAQVSGPDAVRAQPAGPGDAQAWTNDDSWLYGETFSSDDAMFNADGLGDADGPYDAVCQAACNNVAAAHCPAEPPVAECWYKCSSGFVQNSPTCGPLYQAYIACLAGVGKVTCAWDGLVDPTVVCPDQAKALNTCFGIVPLPGGCEAGPCFVSPGGNGTGSCGCSEACPPNSAVQAYKVACDEKQCICTLDGVDQAPVAVSDGCAAQGNTVKAKSYLNSLCKAP